MSAAINTKIWMAMKNSAAARVSGYAVDWPLETFVKPDADGQPAPYIEVRHLPAGIAWRPIKSEGRQEYIGVLQIALLWPVGQVNEKTPSEAVLQRIGVIADRFKTDMRMRFEDVAVRVTQAPELAQPFRDGAYWRIPVSINYSCFAN